MFVGHEMSEKSRLNLVFVNSTAVQEVLFSGQPRYLHETLPHIVIFIFNVRALCVVYHVALCKCTMHDVTCL